MCQEVPRFDPVGTTAPCDNCALGHNFRRWGSITSQRRFHEWQRLGSTRPPAALSERRHRLHRPMCGTGASIETRASMLRWSGRFGAR